MKILERKANSTFKYQIMDSLKKLMFECQTAEIELSKIKEEYEERMSKLTNEANNIGKKIKLITTKVQTHEEFIDEMQKKIINRLNESNQILADTVEKSKYEGRTEDRDIIVTLGIMIKDLSVEFDDFLLDKYGSLFRNFVKQEKDFLLQRADQIQIESRGMTDKVNKEAESAKEKIDNLKRAIEHHKK